MKLKNRAFFPVEHEQICDDEFGRLHSHALF